MRLVEGIECINESLCQSVIAVADDGFRAFEVVVVPADDVQACLRHLRPNS